MVLGMAAQSYYNKTKKGKKEMKGSMKKASRKRDIGNMSQQDAQRAGISPQEVINARRKKAMQKAILKKRNKKSSANTGDGTSAAQGKYGK